jgi:hypothetical protein
MIEATPMQGSDYSTLVPGQDNHLDNAADLV